MDNLNIIISGVIVGTIVFLLTRAVLLAVIRRRVYFHAERVYTLSLQYVGEQRLELLTARQAFYDAVLSHRKVHKSLVLKLESLLSHAENKELEESLEYLKNIDT